MKNYNEQGQKHGPWEKYYLNGKLVAIEYYIT